MGYFIERKSLGYAKRFQQAQVKLRFMQRRIFAA